MIMAKSKRLTDAEGQPIDINVDNLAYMRRGREDQLTTLFFMGTEIKCDRHRNP